MNSERLTCSICLERFVQPRTTKCGHTFCENCIFTFVFKTQSNGTSECPLCRDKIDIKTTEVTEQLLQDTFPLNLELINEVEIETESRNRPEVDTSSVEAICSPCKEAGNEQKAQRYCLNCLEPLCTTCCEWHKKFKLSKLHEVVTLTTSGLFEDKTLTDILGRFSKCNKHAGNDHVRFCREHAVFCCIQCVSDEHRHCKLQNTSDIGDRSVSKISFVSGTLNNVIDHIDTLLRLKQNDGERLLSDIDVLSDKVNSIRDELIARIEKQFSDAMASLKEIKLRIDNHGHPDIEMLTNLKKRCQEKIDDLKKLEACSTSNYVFNITQAVQQDLEVIQKDLAAIDERTTTGVLSCDYTGQSQVESFINLFNINFEWVPSKHEHFEFSEDLVNDYIIEKLDPVEIDVGLTLPLFSCIDAYDSTIALFDNVQSEVYIYDVTKGSQSRFRIDNSFSMVLFDNHRVLVSKPWERTVSLINITSGDERKLSISWQIKAKPYTLCRLKDGRFLVQTKEPKGFLSFNINGTVLTYGKHIVSEDIKCADLNQVEYFTVDAKRSHLILSVQEDINAINCFTFEGETVFSFQNPVLECPQGVTVDNFGNIYVCNHSYFSPSVIILSSNGVLLNQIKENIPRKPMAIYFDKSHVQFWLTSNYMRTSNTIHGYKLVKLARD